MRTAATTVTHPAIGGPANTLWSKVPVQPAPIIDARGRCGMAETESATTRVCGVPRVRKVPEWVVPPLAQFAWMEHGLLWCYVELGSWLDDGHR